MSAPPNERVEPARPVTSDSGVPTGRVLHTQTIQHHMVTKPFPVCANRQRRYLAGRAVGTKRRLPGTGVMEVRLVVMESGVTVKEGGGCGTPLGMAALRDRSPTAPAIGVAPPAPPAAPRPLAALAAAALGTRTLSGLAPTRPASVSIMAKLPYPSGVSSTEPSEPRPGDRPPPKDASEAFDCANKSVCVCVCVCETTATIHHGSQETVPGWTCADACSSCHRFDCGNVDVSTQSVMYGWLASAVAPSFWGEHRLRTLASHCFHLRPQGWRHRPAPCE